MIIEKEIVIVYAEACLFEGQREELRKRMEKEFPGMQIAIVDGGVKVELALQKKRMDRIARATERFADQFNQVSAGGNDLLTEVKP